MATEIHKFFEPTDRTQNYLKNKCIHAVKKRVSKQKKKENYKLFEKFK